MRILIEAGAALRLVARLTDESAVARRLRAGLSRLGGDVQDPGLRAGLAQLGDQMGDVLELVEADLALLASKVRGASRAYDQVEGARVTRLSSLDVTSLDVTRPGRTGPDPTRAGDGSSGGPR